MKRGEEILLENYGKKEKKYSGLLGNTDCIA